MSELPSSSELVYCFGCNERFRSADVRQICPRCGQPAGEAIPTGPTFLWRSAEAWGARQAPAPGDIRDEPLELVGQTVGDYEILSLLGRGGMGYVFHTRHLPLDRYSALKVLSPHLISRDPDYLDRFVHEGQVMAAIMHPNIVSIYNIDQIGSLHCLDMEYVPGRSLQHLLNEHRLSAERALFLGSEVAWGLSEAHRLGILHRDLKPDNILMTLNGVPKIADFGLAKRLEPAAGRGMIPAGTPHYMAPELFGGEAPTPATDVYALGVCLYQMLTGRLPFLESGMNALINAVTTTTAPALRLLRPELPLDVAEVVHLMLEKSPANRPQTGIEAAQLLDAVIGGMPDLQALVAEAFDHEPHVRWKPVSSGFEFKVPIPGGRQQQVWIESTGTAAREKILKITTRCCPAEPHYYERALRINNSVVHGALMIQDIEGVPWFLMQNCYPRFTVDAEEVRRSVLEIAFHGDAVEREITGVDRN